jgi:hypothetical protein
MAVMIGNKPISHLAPSSARDQSQKKSHWNERSRTALSIVSGLSRSGALFANASEAMWVVSTCCCSRAMLLPSIVAPFYCRSLLLLRMVHHDYCRPQRILILSYVMHVDLDVALRIFRRDLLHNEKSRTLRMWDSMNKSGKSSCLSSSICKHAGAVFCPRRVRHTRVSTLLFVLPLRSQPSHPPYINKCNAGLCVILVRNGRSLTAHSSRFRG